MSFEKLPFKETYSTDHPIQLYAATKKSNEIIAHAYSHIYKMPTTGLRFYSLWIMGRPDMALLNLQKIFYQKIDVFNYGKHTRDFTFIDDIVQGIFKSIKKIPKENKKFNFKKPLLSKCSEPFSIYNIGNGKQVKLMKYISEIEDYLKIKAKKNFIKLQKGDIKDTHSDLSKIKKNLNYKSSTSVKNGVRKFLDWYLQYYKINK